MSAEVVFKGKIITKEQVIRALNQFDSQYPNTNDYNSWLEKKTYKYAVRYNNKCYPCKFILSQASGFEMSEFSGGEQTNRVFQKLGFAVAPKSEIRSR